VLFCLGAKVRDMVCLLLVVEWSEGGIKDKTIKLTKE
jgi:hypothetical protein